jgi:hypothetical protein
MQKDVIEKICQDMILDIPLSWPETHRKKLDKICLGGIRRSELDGVSGVPFLFWKMMVLRSISGEMIE